MIVFLVGALVVFLVSVKVRRFRLAGQALRADRQPRAEWSARYPRSPMRRIKP